MLTKRGGNVNSEARESIRFLLEEIRVIDGPPFGGIQQYSHDPYSERNVLVMS